MPAQIEAQLERSWGDVACSRRARGGRRRHRRRARHQLLHLVRDRAEDSRALGAPLRGLLGRRPDARPGRRDRARLARVRRRPVRAGARGDGARPSSRSRAAARGLSSSPTTPRAQRGDVALPLVAGVPEWLSPLVAVVPGQLRSAARLRGIDLDTAGCKGHPDALGSWPAGDGRRGRTPVRRAPSGCSSCSRSPR